MLKKDKLDFRLVNLALITLIVYLLYKTGHLWMGVTNKIFGIIVPFIVAFALAYAMHPFVEKLTEKNIKRKYALAIVIIATFAIMFFVIYFNPSIYAIFPPPYKTNKNPKVHS